MGYLIFVLTLLLFVAIGLLVGKYKNHISRKTQVLIGASFLAIALLIGIYNTLQEKESENLSTLKSAFVRDIPLVCSYQSSAIEITQTDFNLSNGTMSFQGKPNSSYSHIIIPLQDCTLQEVD